MTTWKFRWPRFLAWPWRARRRKASTHLSMGLWGEMEAAAELKRRGYRLVGRRVRVGRRDELDIVAEHGGALVFVEVKTRRSDVYGRPISAVDNRKRRALCRAAVRYLGRVKRRDVPFRFDVVEVIGTPEGGAREIRHIENAFPLERRYVVGGS